MKIKVLNLTIFLLLIIGCGGKRQADNESFITIDVTANYPTKELILQDFMDVEYVLLETSDDFICEGFLLAVGKEIIILRNWIDDGDIFIFNRNGKGLRKINRKGQGGGDYLHPTKIVLDENNEEIFILDYISKKVVVYDLYGQFKRRLNNDNPRYTDMFHYFDDTDFFISYDHSMDHVHIKAKESYHAIISKSDRSIIRNINIPYKEVKATAAYLLEGETIWSERFNYNAIIPHKNNFILSLPASDTAYTYFPDHSLLPFMVRTPSIQTMDPEVFLFPQILTDNYYFFHKVIKHKWESVSPSPFQRSQLVYDRKEKSIYKCTVYNDDFANKKTVDLSQQELVGNDIAFWGIYGAEVLVESYKNGDLKGRLKEIAATLDAEDNPVIMLVKHKQ